MLAPQVTAPATLPTHTIPLNKPSHPPIRSFAPALAQRKNYIPLYIAEAQNEATCTTRQPLHAPGEQQRSV
jgi:hypothetical protein